MLELNERAVVALRDKAQFDLRTEIRIECERAVQLPDQNKTARRVKHLDAAPLDLRTA